MSSPTILVEELLYALAGYPSGDAVIASETAFELHETVVISRPDREICERVLRAGFCAHKLDRFIHFAHLSQTESLFSSADVASATETDKESGTTSKPDFPIGQYEFALSEAIEEYLEKCYRPLLEDLEAREDAVTLVELHAEIQKPRVALEKLVDLVEARVFEGSAVTSSTARPLLIDHLWNLAHNTRDDCRAIYGLCLTKCAEVFVAQLQAWCVHGLLHDPAREFLVRPAATSCTSSGGTSGSKKTAAANDDLDEAHELTPAFTRYFWTHQFGLDYDKAPRVFIAGATPLPPSRGQEHQHAARIRDDYGLEQEDSLEFGFESRCEQILFLGKAVRALMLSHAGLTPGEKKPLLGKLGQLVESVKARFPAVEPFDRGAAVPAAEAAVSKDASRGREEYVAPPSWVMEAALSALKGVIGKKLRHLLVNKGELLAHLTNIKGYFGCSFGPFYQTFLDQAHDLFLNPPTVFAESELAFGAWSVAKQSEEAAVLGGYDAGEAGESGAEETGDGAVVVGNIKQEEALRAALRPLQSRYDTRLAWSIEELQKKKSPTAFEYVNSNATGSGLFQIRLLTRGFYFQDFLEAANLVQCSGPARATADGRLELKPAGISDSNAFTNNSSSTSVSACPAMAWATTRQVVAEPFKTRLTFQLKEIAPSMFASSAGKQGSRAPAAVGARFALLYQNRADPATTVREESAVAALRATQLLMEEEDCGGELRGEEDVVGAAGATKNSRSLSASSSAHDKLMEHALGLEIVVLDGEIACRVAVKRGEEYRVFCEGLLEQGPQAEASSAHGNNAAITIELKYDGDSVSVFANDSVVCTTTTAGDFVDLYSEISPDPLGCGYLGLVALPWEGPQEVDVQLTAVSVKSWKHSLLGSSAASSSTGAVGQKLSTAPAPNPHEEEEIVIDPWHRDLALCFDVPWPLSLIVTYENLSSYNRLFRLLFAYKRALYGLSRIWLRRGTTAGGTGMTLTTQFEQLARQNLTATSRRSFFRHQLYFFVTQILQYLQQDVIEAGFVNLSNVVTDDSKDFDDLLFAHQFFLSQVLGDCFLLDNKILKCLLGIVSISNRFVRIGNVGLEGRSSAQYLLMEERLEAKLKAEFGSVRAELFRLLEQLESSSAKLQSLLLRLRFNECGGAGMAGG
eukprot:g15367.t1